MPTTVENIAAEIKDLVQQGLEMSHELYELSKGESSKGMRFRKDYETWYTVSRRVVNQLIPEREEDFVNLYRFKGNRKAMSFDNYRITDFLQGTSEHDYFGIEISSTSTMACSQFRVQVQILQSALSRSTSSIMDIKEVLAADLFDNELEKARALHKNKLLREAGVIAGVVLEAHLQKVATTHAVKIAKKDPAISDLNDPLKNGGVYDVTTWRLIQRFGDIRNLCGHKKHRDPTPDEVVEFIDGTDKITKTVN